ncbi:MAG: RNA 3'-terminal phosphate cyclase [Caldimicrobium thiodismutans]
MLFIDGSYGEGGGQVLRTALALSAILQKPFKMINLRAKRPKPGLQPQHLACVRAIKEITSAETKGDELHSEELIFTPKKKPPRGFYTFDIGTAGATTLLFQTLLYPLALSEGGEVLLKGGTHVPFSPPYHYLEYVYLPIISLFGFKVSLFLEKAGFYPKGGGIIRARIEKAQNFHLPFFEKGFIPEKIYLISLISEDLPSHILERQAKAAIELLSQRGLSCEKLCEVLYEKVKSISPGTMLFIYATSQNKRVGFTALGKKGLPAEKVGKNSAEEFLNFLKSSAQLEEYMGDQILLPASLVLEYKEKGYFTFEVSKITGHLLTQAFLIPQFLPKVKIRVLGNLGEKGEVILERA